MGFGKGSPATSTSTTAPPAFVTQNVESLQGRANTQSQQPFNLPAAPVAGFSGDQTSAFQTVRDAQGGFQPYIDQAAGYGAQAAAPTIGNVDTYLNPFQSQITQATLDQLKNYQDQQQQGLTSQLIGAPGGPSAWGGDRAALMKTNLAGQQGLATGSTLAGLNQANWTQALAAAQQDQARQGQAAYTFGNLGSLQQQLGLSGAGAQLQTGGLQQQLAQAQQNAPYQQQVQQQAYPFQTLSWLASVLGGTSGAVGSTTNKTGTSEQPSPFSQVAGLGLTAAGMFLKRGGRVKGYDRGGVVPFWDSQSSIVPAPISIPSQMLRDQSGEDKFPTRNDPLAAGAKSFMSGMRGRGNGFFGQSSEPLQVSPESNFSGIGDIMPMGFGSSSAGLGSIYERGGAVGYDEGGEVPLGFMDRASPAFRGLSFEDRAQPAEQAIQDSTFDPQGMNYTGFLAAPPDLPPPSPGIGPGAPTMMAGSAPTRSLGQAAPQLPPVMTASRAPQRPQMAFSGDDGSESPGVESLGYTSDDESGDESPTDISSAGRKGILSGREKPSLGRSLMAAGLGIMSGTSRYPGVNIGSGGLKGIQNYQEQEKELRNDAAQKSLESYRNKSLELKAEQLSDMAKKTQKQLMIQQQSADSLGEYRKAQAGAGRYTHVGTGADGKPIYLDQKTGKEVSGGAEIGAKPADQNRTDVARERNAVAADKAAQGNWRTVGTTPDGKNLIQENTRDGTTKIIPVEGGIAGKPGASGGGKQSVFELKRSAWLHAHPEDEQGALDYASGRRAITEFDVQKAARNMATAEVKGMLVPPRDMKTHVDNRTKEIAAVLKGTGVAPVGGSATPSETPSETSEKKPAQQTPAQKPAQPSEAEILGAARKALQDGKDPEAVNKLLRDKYKIDPSRLNDGQ